MTRCSTVVFLLLLSVINISAQDKKWAIMPDALAKHITAQCSRPVPTFEGTWTTTEADVRTMEARFHDLESLDGSQNDARKGIVEVHVERPARFYRQYVGLVIGGERSIYINASAFKNGAGDKWMISPFAVCDGGVFYWGVLYNPTTATFSELWFNTNVPSGDG
jgi:hypothetical protein